MADVGRQPENIRFEGKADTAEILRIVPISAKLGLAHGDFYFACERDQRKRE